MNYQEDLLDSGQEGNKCPPPILYSVRFLVAFLSLLGTAIMYITRVNLNIAILAMVSGDPLIEEMPPLTGNSSLILNEFTTQSISISSVPPKFQPGEFNWGPTEQGIILG